VGEQTMYVSTSHPVDSPPVLFSWYKGNVDCGAGVERKLEGGHYLQGVGIWYEGTNIVER